MTTRILFVCLGNICRSPAAEGVMRVRGKGHDLALDSAGTGNWHVGAPPYEPMQRAALARGYDLSRQRARQFVQADFDRFDLIIAMDGNNLRSINVLGEGKTTPVRLFSDYADWPVRDVPDPYYTRDFEASLDMIEACADGLLLELT